MSGEVRLGESEREQIEDALIAQFCDCGDFDGHPGDCAATPIIYALTRLAAVPVPSDTGLAAAVEALADRWEEALAEVLADSPSSIFTDRSVITLDGCLRELRRALLSERTATTDGDGS